MMLLLVNLRFTAALVVDELITKSVHGFYEHTGVSELLSKTFYVRVHGAGVHLPFVTPDSLQQSITALRTWVLLRKELWHRCLEPYSGA